MAYNTPATQTTGDLITTAIWNAEVVDNAVELAKGGYVVVFDGGGATLSTDLSIEVPYIPSQFTITDVTLKSSDTGDLTLDIRVPAITSNSAAASDSICGASFPALSCDSYYHDGTLTGWTKQVASGKSIVHRITAAVAVTKASLSVNFTRSS